jgi:hypothetical protein
MPAARRSRRVCRSARVSRSVVGVAVVAALAVTSACSKARSSVVPATGAPSSGVSSSSPANSASAPPSSSASAAPSSGADPLTGLPETASAAKRPALAVKVDNVLGAWPQAGLNYADIVWDLPVEGGLTRLLAIFHSQDVPLVGPIRSARPVDSDILPLFGHTYYAFSGGTPSDLNPIADHSGATAMWWDVTPSLFVTRTDHKVPHQVFATSSMLYAGGQARKPSTTPPPAVFSYSPSPVSGSTPATSVTASYPSATASWAWDGTKYLRTQNGNPDMLMDNGQVSSSNVVVMSVAVQATSARDSHGSVVPLPMVIGTGTVWVFRNGTVIKGIWNRPKLGSPLKLVTSSGATITLSPGRTWVEVLPNSSQPAIH